MYMYSGMHVCIHLIHTHIDSEVPCMCLCFWENLLIGGFTNGQIVIYNSDSGAKAIEIGAHARSITSLDVAPDSGLVREEGRWGKVLPLYLRQFQVFISVFDNQARVLFSIAPSLTQKSMRKWKGKLID